MVPYRHSISIFKSAIRPTLVAASHKSLSTTNTVEGLSMMHTFVKKVYRPSDSKAAFGRGSGGIGKTSETTMSYGSRAPPGQVRYT